ncbi:hypothetical protein OUZ56_029972 [Daphnia magna]|uniref:Tyr recombinase domain-containing protein n=1 Tax=Daphnia magna TaxID=35525 RepID=A0ABR0B8C3_9CRUS|nr:hypothetical protein OUZ56_029972 [Daphnia magna]
MNETENSTRADLKTVLGLLNALEFLINWDKSVTAPTQTIGYLGMVVDSNRLSFSLPSAKVEEVKNMCRKALVDGVVSDNSTAFCYMNKGVGTRSSELTAVAKSLVEFCEQTDLKIKAVHLPGVMNGEVDRESRTTGATSDWKLKHSVFNELQLILPSGNVPTMVPGPPGVGMRRPDPSCSFSRSAEISNGRDAPSVVNDLLQLAAWKVSGGRDFRSRWSTFSWPKTVLLLALASLLRVSELAAINFQSVIFSEDDVKFTLLKLRKAQRGGPLQSIVSPKLLDVDCCPGSGSQSLR